MAREEATRPESETARERSSVTAPPPSFVYAFGRVEPQFPNIAIEKEVAQAIGRSDTSDQTDRQAMSTLLSERHNRYLVRKMCWVFTISGLETYILVPRDPMDYDLLIESYRPDPDPSALDVVIGVQGGIAPPEVCNGLMVPVVYFDQLYSFGRDELVDSIPRPEGLDKKGQELFRSSAAGLLERVLLIGENAGTADEHRALNYLAVRYPDVYHKVAQADRDEASLASVDVRPLARSTTRKAVEVVFAFTHRRTNVTEKFAIGVDVEDEFPFLVSALSPYFDRTSAGR